MRFCSRLPALCTLHFALYILPLCTLNYGRFKLAYALCAWIDSSFSTSIS